MTTLDQAPVTDELATMNCQRAINSALAHEMAVDSTLLVIGEDIADPPGGVIGTTKGLSTEFGTDRVLATPIAEQAIIGTAIGAAIGGYRPVAEIMFCDFLAVCADQFANHAAKLRYMSGGRTGVPMTVMTVVAGGRFGAQHTQSLEAWFMHVPGVKVVMPSNPADAKGLLLSCIRDDDPCLFVQPLALMFNPKGEVPVGDHSVPLGSAAICRAGRDLTMVAYGAQVPVALSAATALASEGVDVEVIDLRSLLPIDMDTVLASVAKTRRAIVTHTATEFLGPGAEISAQIHEQLFGELAAPVARLGAPFSPIPFSPELQVFPNESDLQQVARKLLAV